MQAEVIVAALEMYRQTKDAAYLDVFEKTWRFIDTAQTDWTNGEWFESIAPDGTPSRGNKATPWKAGYHNGRALLQVLDRLARLDQYADGKVAGGPRAGAAARPAPRIAVCTPRGRPRARVRRALARPARPPRGRRAITTAARSFKCSIGSRGSMSRPPGGWPAARVQAPRRAQRRE